MPIQESTAIKEALLNKFKSTWKHAVADSSKLEFYAQVKGNVALESYLDIKNREVRRSVAQLRSSSHRLNIETARYLNTTTAFTSSCRSSKCRSSFSKEWSRSCKTCCSQEVEFLQQLPFAVKPITEDERHILATCPAYHHLRTRLSDSIKSSLLAWDERLTTLFDEPSVHEFALYVHKIFQTRFPKHKKVKTNVRGSEGHQMALPSAS